MFQMDRVNWPLRANAETSHSWSNGGAQSFRYGEIVETLRPKGLATPSQHYCVYLYVQFIFEPWQDTTRGLPFLNFDSDST